MNCWELKYFKHISNHQWGIGSIRYFTKTPQMVVKHFEYFIYWLKHILCSLPNIMPAFKELPHQSLSLLISSQPFMCLLYYAQLEDTARYAGLLLAPAEGFGHQPRLMLFWPNFGNFWCPVVTLLTLSSNLRNFEKNPPKKIQKK